MKEIAKNFALTIKNSRGKFPLASEWIIRNGYPYSYVQLLTLFNGSYNSFREYCGEPILKRTVIMSLEWMKSNCVIDDNQCWNWGKSITDSGYGRTNIGNRKYFTHRLAYQLQYGDISESLVVRHKCDNRKCCNPEHLELGTPSDNRQDVLSRNLEYVATTNPIVSNLSKKYTNLPDRIDFYLKNCNEVESCLISNIIKPTTDGYYNIHFNGSLYKLHRLVLANKLNKKYEEIDISRHTCNNKSCINPNHLIEGSKSENSKDSREYSLASKLSVDNVKEIKASALQADFSTRGSKTKFDTVLALKFNVSPKTIASIRRNKKWVDIAV